MRSRPSARLRRKRGSARAPRTRTRGTCSPTIGDPLSPAAVSATFRKLMKTSGLPPLTLHGLRHTFATVGLDSGVDVLYVAEVLGHSSPAITQSIYQHTRQDRKIEAVERIGSAIFRN